MLSPDYQRIDGNGAAHVDKLYGMHIAHSAAPAAESARFEDYLLTEAMAFAETYSS